jgi:hypothetical protein
MRVCPQLGDARMVRNVGKNCVHAVDDTTNGSLEVGFNRRRNSGLVKGEFSMHELGDANRTNVQL